MPDLIKVGITDDLERRMKELDKTGTPLPFECFYAVEIDEDAVTYESSKKEKRIDLAIRYSKVIEDFDIGFSHFHGNARDPELNINQSTLKLNPYYPILTQTSMDIQATKKSWLYKLEALTAKIQSERHVRAAGGFEYTFYGIKDTSQDLGIVAEYLFFACSASIVFIDVKKNFINLL